MTILDILFLAACAAVALWVVAGDNQWLHRWREWRAWRRYRRGRGPAPLPYYRRRRPPGS